jgi:hypothetical protein
MKNTEDGMSNREWIHKLVDMIEDEGDLAMVKWLVQPYAARALNKKYKEEQNHEEDQ